ncbi:MAG: T9SS type A sorting domain-containing protein [Bacteroidales bacterium]|nr:T9SS type A sorting domain-containing protein [Bacteroidales bacterium]
MKQLFFSCCLALLFSYAARAQNLEVHAPAGGYEVTAGNGSLSWTLGEVVTETHKPSNATLTQGFQQSGLSITVENNFTEMYIEVTVYPNPTTGILHLLTDVTETLQYQLFDINGSVLKSGETLSASEELDLSALPPAVYYLKITRGNQVQKTFQIVKH